MNTHLRIVSLIGSTTFLIFLAGCGVKSGQSDIAESTERPVQLKLASSFHSGAVLHGETIVHLAKRVEAASDGGIKIKVYDPGKLVAALEVLDAVSAGKVDAGYSTPGYWMGKIPAAPFFAAVPFGPDGNEYMAWFFAGNGMKLYQEMYDRYGFNVKVFICAIFPPETSGWFAHEIRSREDLDGLKMRFFGLGGNIMEKLGVAVNLLPGGEIFPALEKGVIDATEFALPSIDEDMGFYKIVKYNYFPGWHQQATAFEFFINKDVWESLSPRRQAIIEMASRDTIVFSIARAEATQTEVMHRNEAERGVKNTVWPPEMLELFKQKWLEVVAEETKADPFFKNVYDDYSQFRKNYAIWGSKAYLPRAKSK